MLLTIIVIAFILFLLYGVYQVVPFKQIGPTCGYYAVTYAVNKVTHINKKKEVEIFLKYAIETEYSHIGEAFDIEQLCRCSQEYFPDVKIEIVNFTNKEEIESLAETKVIVFPYIKTTLPHFCVLTKKYREKVKCWNPSTGITTKRTFSYLMSRNLIIKKQFNWWLQYIYYKPYENTRAEYWKKMRDKKLYSYLKETYENKEEMLTKKKTPINLKEKAIVISEKRG